MLGYFYYSAVQIKNAICVFRKHSQIEDTSINRTIILQSTPVLKSCTALSHERELIISLLISAGFLQGKGKQLATNLQCIYRVFTLWGSTGDHLR